MTAPTWLVDLLAEHTVADLGEPVHRVHLAGVIAAELRARLGSVGDLGVREQWPPDEWRAALAAVAPSFGHEVLRDRARQAEAKLRDMEIERNMLRITTEELAAKVARVEEAVEMYESCGPKQQSTRDVLAAVTAALADEGGDDE